MHSIRQQRQTGCISLILEGKITISRFRLCFLKTTFSLGFGLPSSEIWCFERKFYFLVNIWKVFDYLWWCVWVWATQTNFEFYGWIQHFITCQTTSYCKPLLLGSFLKTTFSLEFGFSIFWNLLFSEMSLFLVNFL